MIPLITAAQMRRLDSATTERLRLPPIVLMEVAGRAVADVAEKLVVGGATGAAAAAVVARGPIVVLVGPGNNGADGLVAARHLHERGLEVIVWLAVRRNELRELAALQLAMVDTLGLQVVELPAVEADLVATLPRPPLLVVDALLGLGLSREVTGPFRALIERVVQLDAPLLAVDVPSGLSADTGLAMGQALVATKTVTFAYPKVGLVGWPGCEAVGDLAVVDIGIPRQLLDDETLTAEPVRAWQVERADVVERLPLRSRGGHKGQHGHLLVLAGSPGKSGAACLAARAGLRIGAGLVTIATGSAAATAIEASKSPELMVETLWSEGHEGAASTFEALQRLAVGKRALAIGPGLGTSEAMGELVLRILAELGLPTVVDADALAALVRVGGPVVAAAPFVLTPHPGEAARLLGLPVREVQADRLGAARALASRYGGCVALKGARTVVATPDGRAYLITTGNEGLGTAGTGDVLTGMVAGLVAQGAVIEDALVAGTWLHGAAGDLVCAGRGSRGMVASDVIESLPQLFQLLSPR